jgi:hypothetical protein
MDKQATTTDKSVNAAKPADKAPEAAGKNDWRSHMQTVASELQQLKGLDKKDPQYKHLVDDIDKRFQQALPQIKNDAKGTDAGLITNVSKGLNTESDFNKMMADPGVQSALCKAFHVTDLSKANITPQQLDNVILQTKDQPTRQKLAQLASLADLSYLSQVKVADQYWNVKAPISATLEYADFLLKYKNGVSQAPDGSVQSASDIVRSVHSAEMAASPRGQEVAQKANEASTGNQGLMVPLEKNPFVQTMKAIQSTDPAAKLSGMEQAGKLAQDPFFDPKNLSQQIDLAKKDPSDTGKQKLAALEQFKHARALTEGYIGYAMLQQAKPDFKAALTHLTNALADPVAADAITDSRGKPMLTQLIGTAAFGNQADFTTNSQGYLKSMKDGQTHATNYQKALKQNDSASAAKELDAAISSTETAVKYGESLRNSLGPNAGKIEQAYDAVMSKPANERTPEETAMAQQIAPYVSIASNQAQAMMTLSTFDMAKGDHNAALKQLDDIAKVDPKFLADPTIKAQYDDIHASATKGANYDNESWLAQRYDNAKDALMAAPGNVWNFVKDHATWVAAGVGFAAAAAITIGTGGLGAPVGLAIVAGIVGGGLLGTAAGTATEMAHDKNESLWHAAGHVAPAAFAGAAVGSLLVAAAPVAVEGGSEVAGKLALPGVQALYDGMGGGRAALMAANALRASMVFSSVSAYKTYSDVKSGKDKTIAAAALDFTGSEVQMAGSGALMAGNLGWKAFLAGAVAKNSVTEWAQPEKPATVGAYAWDVTVGSFSDLGNSFFRMPKNPAIDEALKQMYPLTSQILRPKTSTSSTATEKE